MPFKKAIFKAESGDYYHLVPRDLTLKLSKDNHKLSSESQYNIAPYERGIFLFRRIDSYLYTSGWLVFRFSAESEIKSLENAYRAYIFLVNEFSGVHLGARFFYSLGKALTLAIPDSVFREQAPGLYLPIILSSMLKYYENIVPRIDKHIYLNGIYSSLPFPGYSDDNETNISEISMLKFMKLQKVRYLHFLIHEI